MENQFGDTASKLSHGPLGIIALFIVLIHGFSSLLLGFSSNISESNQTVIVWFIVLFPLGILILFAWLVSAHPEKLYGPTSFRDESNFINLLHGRARLDKEKKENPGPVIGTLNEKTYGNLYWLGHDLMWTADVLLRSGPAENVLIGLAQALHHLKEVGLADTSVEEELRKIRDVIENLDELPSALRDNIANQLGVLIDQIGLVAEKAQENFSKPPHWKRVRK